MFAEIAILAVLILVNGVLAMSELAVVQARSSRLKVMADDGSRGAVAALRLASDPGRFLSTVQIGITLVGILAGAISGATLGARLSAALAGAGVPPDIARPLGVGSVVIVITYCSLIVGELVPKQLALRAPERIASLVAPAMLLLARITAPAVWFLDRSGKLVLRLLGQDSSPDRSVSEEEVRLIIAEAETAGVIEEGERSMIAGVMRMADRSARGLMTPRREVELLDADAPFEELLDKMRASQRSRFPVYDGAPDEIIGVVMARDALARDAGDIRALVRQVPVVMDTLSALEVLDRMRSGVTQMVLVYDEYGHFEGVITPMDLLGAIAGEFDSADDPKMVERDDGSWLVAGWMPVDEFSDAMGLKLDPDPDYATVAGLVLERLARIPREGETLRIGRLDVEIVDMDGRRIDKLLVRRIPDEG